MDNKPKRGGFFYLFGPVFLYMIMNQIAQGIGAVCVTVPRVLLSGTIDETMTQQQLQETLMPIVEKIILEHQVEIMGFAALFAAIVPAVFFYLDCKLERKDPLFLPKKAAARYYLWILGLGAVFCIGSNCLMLMSGMVFSDGGYQQVSQVYYQAGFPVQILCLGIIIPAAEELIFRGIFYKRYRAQASFRSAAVLSAVVFALLHSSAAQLLYALFLGLLLAYVYEKYQSLKAPVLLHIVVNIVSLTATRLGLLSILYHFPAVMAVTLVACAFVGAVMFVMIRGMKGRTDVPMAADDEGSYK